MAEHIRMNKIWS